ncbi:MAG: hypothetical protein KatS3mg043_0932 [Rhodothermaceae bacterium]|nr:MAG: hypothetical protein KatS3mg043_0932 [Rhodothermaceae bacterium]
MNRDEMIKRIEENDDPWDMIIIGGGATGLGCAIEAASRGYRALLLEQHDFAKGTSSRSTKLVHGGVRYLRQGNIALVLEALRERGRLLKNAPAPGPPPAVRGAQLRLVGRPLLRHRPAALRPARRQGGLRQVAQPLTGRNAPAAPDHRTRGPARRGHLLRRPVRRRPAGRQHGPDGGGPGRHGPQLPAGDGAGEGARHGHRRDGRGRRDRTDVCPPRPRGHQRHRGLHRRHPPHGRPGSPADDPAPARACTSCSTAPSSRARRPSWYPRPTTGACSSPSPGTTGSSSVPTDTPVEAPFPRTPAPCPKSSTSS